VIGTIHPKNDWRTKNQIKNFLIEKPDNNPLVANSLSSSGRIIVRELVGLPLNKQIGWPLGGNFHF
jgi:hypothetical protein